MITFASFLLACLIFVQGDAVSYLSEEHGWGRLAIASASVLAGLFINNLYAKPQVRSRFSLLLKLCNVLGIALIVQGLLAYVPSGLTLPRAMMLSGGALILIALFFWRVFYNSVLLERIGLQRVLFLGWDAATEEISGRIQSHPELGFAVAGYLAAASGDPVPVHRSSGPYLGSIEDLDRVAATLHPTRIIVATANRASELPMASLLRLSRAGILVEEVATAYEAVCGRVCSHELKPSQIIFFNELGDKPGSVALQSIYTNLLALAAIIITSPLLILIALAVKLTSRGPLLERDIRVGLHSIPFSLHRFRCHRADPAAHDREQLLTPVGRLLQRLHLVNLPRLFNLLRGEITLVGPRPERPEFVEELTRYFAFYQQRHSIKPGMTGWSQIHSQSPGGTANSLIQLEYDLYYTKYISLALDAYILLHGIRAMLPFERQESA
ncbi:MAG: sugar transferase [Acidobacteriota bacterium]|nr:sugar transferase [Acidobacteriota bacterium]